MLVPASQPLICHPRAAASGYRLGADGAGCNGWCGGGEHHWGMPLFGFEGREPAVSLSAWIAPTATLVGDVHVEDGASIWYGAVLRSDFGPIVVRRGANVQDGSVLHGGD